MVPVLLYCHSCTYISLREKTHVGIASEMSKTLEFHWKCFENFQNLGISLEMLWKCPKRYWTEFGNSLEMHRKCPKPWTFVGNALGMSKTLEISLEIKNLDIPNEFTRCEDRVRCVFASDTRCHSSHETWPWRKLLYFSYIY